MSEIWQSVICIIRCFLATDGSGQEQFQTPKIGSESRFFLAMEAPLKICLEACDFAYLPLKIHIPSLSVCHPGMQPHLDALTIRQDNDVIMFWVLGGARGCSGVGIWCMQTYFSDLMWS
jgi:hypothetical protein